MSTIQYAAFSPPFDAYAAEAELMGFNPDRHQRAALMRRVNEENPALITPD